MTFEPFEAAWQRWERAREHLSESVGLWNDFITEHEAFDFHLQGDGAGVYTLRVVQQRPSPPALAVTLGEWLYNLRAALDYVIWATACHVSGTLPPANEAVLQYPIYDDEATWQRNVYRLKGLQDHHRKMLLQMQPFNSNWDANYLGWINRLARIDRHRTLVTGAARVAQLEPVLQVPQGCEVVTEWGERTILNGYADIARFTVRPYRPDMDVRVNPRVGIDPEIAEWSHSLFWSRIPIDNRLKMIQTFVAGEIAVYEYDCTGRGRKEHLVADGFRDECDRRREPSAPLRWSRAPVDWTPAGPGARGNRDQLAGLDFPPHGPGSRGTKRTSETPDGQSDG